MQVGLQTYINDPIVLSDEHILKLKTILSRNNLSIDNSIDDILDKLSPRDTQVLLLHCAAQLEDLV